MNGHNTNNGGRGGNHGGDVPDRLGSYFKAWAREDVIILELSGFPARVVMTAGDAIIRADGLACNVRLQVEGDDPLGLSISLASLTGGRYDVTPTQAVELARVMFDESCGILERLSRRVAGGGKGARVDDDERWELTHATLRDVPPALGGDGTCGPVDDDESDDVYEDLFTPDLGGEGRCGRR
jgi:hypothetical protein